MNYVLKRIVSVALCVSILCGLMFFGAVTSEDLTTASATNHGVYDTLAVVTDYGSCPSMQGFALCGDYFYAIKTDGNDYAATVHRVHKETGYRDVMYNGSNSSYYFYDFGHGNDCDAAVLGGTTTLIVATSTTGANSLVRYKISGTTATKVCGYQMVSPSGSNIGGGAVRIVRVDDTNAYLLFKSGDTLYTGVMPLSQNGGKIVMTHMCTLDYSEVYINGVKNDLSSWSGQGMGYYDHMVYLPLSSHTTSSWNMSIVLVYDIEGASGTILPLPDPTFKITSSAYSALFEMESCLIDPETKRLYFNTNRRVTSSDTNHDGIHYITNWSYEPQNRFTEVNNYRWEMQDNVLQSVTKDGAVYNGLAMHYGKISDNTIIDGRFTTSKTVVLNHDRPWVVEWKSNGNTAGQLLMSAQTIGIDTDNAYLYVTTGNKKVFLGYSSGSQYNNYGVSLSDYGVSASGTKVFRLTNKIAANGTNMVYLSVDGRELGAMNNYYINGTSQGTTSDWVSGQDFKFSYLGTNGHPVNDSIEYIQVWGNGIVGQVDEPDTYRWETTGNALTNISSFDLTENSTTKLWGSVSGTTYTGAQYDLSRNIVLLHNRPWSIEWKGSHSNGSMILCGDNHGNTPGAPYFFRSSILAFGERKGGTHHNYGIKLSDYGITQTDTHVYRLTNRINADGSNMVYLYVDGKEIAPMNQYFKGLGAQGVTSDWLNGRDLTFTHLGAYNYFLSDSIEYLQIWEDGIPTENDPKNFRWEMSGNNLVNVTTGGYSANNATLLAGSISDGSFTSSGYFRLDESVVLAHDRPWSLQWKSAGNTRPMLLSASNTNNMVNAPYLFLGGNYNIIALGERRSSHHNYGIELSAYGITLTDEHEFTLTNQVAADGSNMIYLSVDGKEIGPMNQYFVATTYQNTTSDWVSGKDFVFSYIGMNTYPLDGSLSYMQVFEACAHTFGAWTTKAPTCTADGSRSRSCTQCGYMESEAIKSEGHSYNMTTISAGCNSYEIYQFTCTACGDSYQLNAGELANSWIDYLPAGMDASLFNTKTQYRYSDYEKITSTEANLAGYTLLSSAWSQTGTKTVNYVGSWPSGFSASNSLYSTYNKKSSKVTASETATAKTVVNSDAVVGYIYYHWCYANSYYSVSTSSGSYTTFHAFYSTTDPSTLTNDASDGSYKNSNTSCCSNSDWYWYVAVYAQKSTSYQKQFTYERWTPMSDWSETPVTASDTRQVESRTLYQLKKADKGDHNYNGGVITVQPTCTTPGTKTYTCTICGDSYTETIDNGGHTYNDGVVTTPPDCTTTGVMTYTCTGCGDTYQKSIYATGHSYQSKVTAPTCTANGYTTYTCVDCGDSYVADSVPSTGHSYGGAVVTQPTCSENGYTSYTCMDCGASYKDNIVSALGHKYQSVVTAPTCTADGYTTYTCSVCKDSYVSNTVTAKGHSYQSKVTAPTCTTGGYTTYTCATCGTSYQSDKVAATGHSYRTVVTAPTCTTAGYTTYTCTDCGYTYTGSTVAAKGHSYSAGKCTVCGVADPNYVKQPTLTLKTPTLAFEDEILYNVYFNVDNVSSIVEMGMATFGTRDTAGTVATAQEIIPGYVKNADGTYTVHSNGVPAKMLGDALYFKVYAKLSDGSYAYSDVAGYHAVLYANTVLNSTASAEAKALVVAMLNYGAAAQVDFDYKADTLMNAGLTEAHQALIEAYNESMVAAVPTVSAAKAGVFVNNGGYSSLRPTVSFEGAFSINYYFTPKYTPAGSTITFYYWNLNDFNSVGVLTAANASGTVKMTATNGVYTAAVEGIAAKAIDEPIYIAAVYTNSGTHYYTPVIGYSLGAYCKNLAANGNAFGAATAVYGYYAKAYFA